jgi:hypothetical protein
MRLVASVTINCVCGRASPELTFLETTDLSGGIWQGACDCGRSFTLEVANDPDFREG